MNILFTCAGRRNYLINYFKEALNGEGHILAADQNMSAPAMVDADIAIKVPSIYSPNYIDTLKSKAKEYEINAIISLNDLELPILSRHRSELEAQGTKVLVSDPEIIDIAFDKWETVKFIEKIGLKSPKTYRTLSDTIKAIEQGTLNFPLVVKPRWGSASIGIEFPESMRELELIHELLNIKLKKSILNIASSIDIENAFIFQEKITGEEFGIDVLNDFNREYFGTFARKKLSMRSGETDKAMSFIDNTLSQIGQTLGENSKHLGNMDCDVFVKDGQTYVLELNPRFGGGYPFSHEAGINTAAIYISWLKGNHDVTQFDNYQHGLIFSKCDRMIKIC
ncbi:ATP-grasp domain-containing protein [Flagellimonas olearia]|uniref:ATP-dependent carboxylate-amine ligase n=1 Tax=Flagellimonas olearia TaxID=552546 RepID=A0A444VL00_9FLAO|nr:ATP-grasp domain-containing protein [Allomuricauda olearia]RYC51439.1 ATP-dependent carboxylate-amine ligase [Allomuricauda olearia]